MRLHVQISGDGPDVLLLHGWGANGASWGAFAGQLAARYRVHAVDLPGHGRSRWNPGVREFDRVVAAVRDRCPAGAAVIGWSLGGMIAMRLARRSDTDVAGLVLVSATPRFVQDRNWRCAVPLADFEQFAARVAREPGVALREFHALQTHGESGARERVRELDRLLTVGGHPTRDALDSGLALLRDLDLRSELSAIAPPVLVIAGERDRLVPPCAAEAIVAAIPDARLCVLHGVAHAPVLSATDAMAGCVFDFMASLGRADARLVRAS
jgi:pimeloyl-[acyl-carrier protein] methyl ester esterase